MPTPPLGPPPPGPPACPTSCHPGKGGRSLGRWFCSRKTLLSEDVALGAGGQRRRAVSGRNRGASPRSSR
eukprot:12125585-Alexandrium_andersonii.AAC.2